MPASNDAAAEIEVEESGAWLTTHQRRPDAGDAIMPSTRGTGAIRRGLLGRPMPELPFLQYYVFQLPRSQPPAVVELKRHLLEHANAWQTAR